MKLDVTCMRYLSKDDYRVLQAVEMGMRNHELVPVDLITNIARLRHGGSYKILSTLLRYKLVAHANNNYNGYRLSYMGFDILALRTLLMRGVIMSVGSQIGIGKESDIFEAQDEHGNEVVLKIHRLGRTSFRAVRKNRDYMQGRAKTSWLYMSRLAATKEVAFMKALYARGFPTPTPIDHNRHIVVMSRVHGFPMCQIKSGNMPEEAAEQYFATSMEILVRLARHGLVHCDFNEFNLMIGEKDGTVTLIDFPQMVATEHVNAVELFDRDVRGLTKFFSMKMHYVPPDHLIPRLPDILSEVSTQAAASGEASVTETVSIMTAVERHLGELGMSAEENKDLVSFMQTQRSEGGDVEDDEEVDDEDDDDDEEDVEVDEGVDDDDEEPGLLVDISSGVSSVFGFGSSAIVEAEAGVSVEGEGVRVDGEGEDEVEGVGKGEDDSDGDCASNEGQAADVSDGEGEESRVSRGDRRYLDRGGASIGAPRAKGKAVAKEPANARMDEEAIRKIVQKESKSGRASKDHAATGSRNATKKRTKYGKIDKQKGKIDFMW